MMKHIIAGRKAETTHRGSIRASVGASERNGYIMFRKAAALLTAAALLCTVTSCSGKENKEETVIQKSPVEQLLEGYEPQEQAEDYLAPDIILVMSQAFWNIYRMPETEYVNTKTGSMAALLNHYAAARDAEHSVTGELLTPCFGSFDGDGDDMLLYEVLTGHTGDRYTNGEKPWKTNDPLETYISQYRDAGYVTITTTNILSEAYQNLGFDNRTGSGDYSSLIDKAGYAPTFVLAVNKSSSFSFKDITAKNDKLFQHVQESTEKAARIIRAADEELQEYIEYVDNAKKNTVLVWFGDQLPGLGTEYDTYGAYAQSGMIKPESEMTVDDRRALHTTLFLIYSNFDLHESETLGGKVGRVASYNLMNVLAEVIGAPKTPMMQFLTDYQNNVGAYNAALGAELPEEQQAYADKHTSLTSEILADAGFVN